LLAVTENVVLCVTLTCPLEVVGRPFTAGFADHAYPVGGLPVAHDTEIVVEPPPTGSDVGFALATHPPGALPPPPPPVTQFKVWFGGEPVSVKPPAHEGKFKLIT
jgi:hypothetical protein